MKSEPVGIQLHASARKYPLPGVEMTARRAQRAQSGTATLEFIMAMPLILLLITLVLQYMLALHTRTIVNYAAFSAARSAAVWLPRESEAPPLGEELMGQGTEGAVRVHHAAALPCTAISPADQGLGLIPGGSFGLMGLPAALSALGQPRQLLKHLGALGYANAATTVELQTEDLTSRSHARFRCVVATVRYTSWLMIPIASNLLGHDPPPPGVHAPYGHYTVVTSRYVLPLEEEGHASSTP
jgi:hypothetical protein